MGGCRTAHWSRTHVDASYKFYRTTFSKVTLHKTKGTSTRGLQKININVTLVSSVGPVEANLDTKECSTMTPRSALQMLIPRSAVQ